MTAAPDDWPRGLSKSSSGISGCLYDYQKNCEVIKANGEDMGTSVFVPVAWAPKGYTINIDEYLKGRQLSKKMSTKNS